MNNTVLAGLIVGVLILAGCSTTTTKTHSGPTTDDTSSVVPDQPFASTYEAPSAASFVIRNVIALTGTGE